VERDPGIARLSASRVVSLVDGGRIITWQSATNQIAGAMVMGVGMGQLEHTTYELAQWPSHKRQFCQRPGSRQRRCSQDRGDLLDSSDPMTVEFGAHCIGEFCVAVIAPAIRAAVYQATGERIGGLTVRIENSLKC
jgi:xanthine dehydrogenase YagR molybdenum-binding subunit